MLSTHVLGAVKHVWRRMACGQRSKAQKRLQRVIAWFSHPESGQYLRRSCLAFRLTLTVMSKVAKKPGVGEPPTIVRCCKGAGDGDSAVHGSLQTTLDTILRNLTADPSIDVGATTTLLFCTAMDLGLRLQPFGEWPSKGCLLVQEYNPDGFLVAIMIF
jgi:hypothetical protein